MSIHLRSEDYAALLDGAPDAIVVVDERAIIEFANRRTAELFGWTPEELIGRPIEMLVPDRFNRSHVGERSRYIATPSVRPMGSGRALFARRRDGTEFPVEISLSPLRTDRGQLVSSIIRDVTDRVQREKELERLRELADAANAAKSEFLSSMSHELRTPLNAVLGFAQLLGRTRKNPLDERQREMLGYITRGGEHLLRLIDEILDLARIEAGSISISIEPVDVGDVIREVTTSLQPSATRAGIAIEIEAALEGMPLVAADRTRLVQILMNLGSNAVKYGRQGGRVGFVLHPREENLRVEVVDDGIGIAADKQGLVFQPFQRAGQERGTIEGTGIGLAITKRLAELMGGRLGFESEHGRGSTFWLELPLSVDEMRMRAAPTHSAGPRASPLADREAPTVRIVYIEDNPANVELMVHVLDQFDRIELLTTPTAEAGIELIHRHLPLVVIMDVNLPGISGIEATRRLKASARTRDIPVIGLSAAAMPRDRELAAEVGFFRYLTKPFDIDEMMSALETVLVRRER